MTTSRDTTAQAEHVRIELLRRMPSARRLAIVDGVIACGRTLRMMGLRQRHPGLSDGELEPYYARLVLGPELAERVLAARRARAEASATPGEHGDRPA